MCRVRAKRLRIMGREVIRLLPIPPLAMQLRTGIAILSYANHLVFGIIGDYDGTPDVDELANGIERAVIRLTAISTGHWRSTPVGTSRTGARRLIGMSKAARTRGPQPQAVSGPVATCGWVGWFSPRTLCPRCSR